MTFQDLETEPPIPNTVKMVWATSIAHLFYANPRIEVSVPESWSGFVSVISDLMMFLIVGISGLLTWLIARGITKDQSWARITFMLLTVLSLPSRILSLFYSNSMFDDSRFRLSFFLITGWCIFDIVIIQNLWSQMSASKSDAIS